jgi:hypothetical protein
MNRNVENWLRATLMVGGFIGGIGGVIYTMFKLYAMFPNGFRYGATISILLTFVYAIIYFIKEELDAKDASDKYWEDTYPSYSKTKKKKETHKEFMERLDDAWEKDFGKKG